MAILINGLHHVTAIAGDPQKNINFYIGVLGLRLVKKTVNFDAPDIYHFYYGDNHGTPGTLLTFFPYGNIKKGKAGRGQINTTSFSIGRDSLPFWMERFKKFNMVFKGPFERLDEAYIQFEDDDGLLLELVANGHDLRTGWDNGTIPLVHAIKGFHSVSMNIGRLEPTQVLLTDLMEHRLIHENGSFFRFESGSGGPGTYLDIHVDPNLQYAIPGGGTIHHVAFSTDNDDTQATIREHLAASRVHVTEVLDRQYFNSIYFREPGGVLFEIATDPPGFTIDEDISSLGTSLKLPSWQEKNRDHIERNLKSIQLPKFT